jgi:hypothetical protein
VRNSIFATLCLLVSACSAGGGGGPQCRQSGGTCSVTGDCCMGLVCTNSKCATPSQCGAAGDNCAMSSDCCQGLTCNGGKCGMQPMCSGVGQACSNTQLCCQGEMCTNGTCTGMDTRKPFGSACTMDGDCLTNQCLGYQGVSGRFCSQACNGSATCAALSANPQYWCISGGQGVNYCERSCTKAADCTDIGASWTCRQVANIENQVYGICGVYVNQPEGSPCLDNSQCAQQACNGVFCSHSCVNDAACGAYAKCMFTQNQSYNCFPSCTNNADCAIFGAGLTCQAGTSRDNASVMICSG